MKPPAHGGPVTLRSRRLTFSGRLPGTWSEPRVVTLTNRGTIPLSIRSAEITGPHAGDFAICAEDFSGVHLYPGSSCTVSVRFNPSETGWRTAALLLNGRGRNSPWRVALAGYGASLELVSDCPDLVVRKRDIMTITVVALGRCGEPILIWGEPGLIPSPNCQRALRQELLVAVPISVHVRARCEESCEPVTAVFHSMAVQVVQVTVPMHFDASPCGSKVPPRPHPEAQTCGFHIVQRLQVEVPVTFDAEIA